jgi:hypothetical protein
MSNKNGYGIERLLLKLEARWGIYAFMRLNNYLSLSATIVELASVPPRNFRI